MEGREEECREGIGTRGAKTSDLSRRVQEGGSSRSAWKRVSVGKHSTGKAVTGSNYVEGPDG